MKVGGKKMYKSTSVIKNEELSNCTGYGNYIFNSTSSPTSLINLLNFFTLEVNYIQNIEYMLNNVDFDFMNESLESSSEVDVNLEKLFRQYNR
jgi:hypothetical protein